MIRKFTYLDYYQEHLVKHNPSMNVLVQHKGNSSSDLKTIC